MSPPGRQGTNHHEENAMGRIEDEARLQREQQEAARQAAAIVAAKQEQQRLQAEAAERARKGK